MIGNPLKIKDFYLFRHGQTSFNVEGRAQGQLDDSVLTEVGKEQSKTIGKLLAEKKIEILISSPLRRALQSADLVNKSLKVQILEDKRFREAEVGKVEGLLHSEIEDKYPEKYRLWKSSACEFDNIACFDGGETKKQIRERVMAALNDYAENSKYKVLAVATHKVVLEQILIALKAGYIEVKNGAILHVVYNNGNWIFKKWIE